MKLNLTDFSLVFVDLEDFPSYTLSCSIPARVGNDQSHISQIYAAFN